jgi:hypothetical protein
MSEHNTNKQTNEEVDLIGIFTIIGNGFKRVFNFFGKILYNLFALIMRLLIFIRKKIVYILIAFVLGLVYTSISDKLGADVYESQAILQTNFQVELQLKSRLEEYEQLIENNDTIELGRRLEITPEEAASIYDFDIKPFYSMNRMRFEYYDYIYETDSTIKSSFTFDEYEEDLRFEDYKEYEIKVVSGNKDVFEDLNEKLWDFSNFDNLELSKKRNQEMYLRKRALLEKTLSNIDSTRAAKRKALVKQAENNNTNGSRNIFEMGGNSGVSEEQVLYENEKLIRDELFMIDEKISRSENIINVIKKFEKTGVKPKSTNKIFSILYFVFGAIIILLIIEFFKYLSREETVNKWTFRKL